METLFSSFIFQQNKIILEMYVRNSKAGETVRVPNITWAKNANLSGYMSLLAAFSFELVFKDSFTRGFIKLGTTSKYVISDGLSE